MKLYQSAYTYLPFVYLYMTSTVVGTIYHSADPKFVRYRPYTVLVMLLVNTMVHRFYKNKLIVRSMLHKTTWKCVTNTIYAIVENLVHEMVFSDHHFNHYHHNMGWSVLYLSLTLITGYALSSSDALSLLHLAFFLVPIKRIWQVNLYMFTIFVSCSIYMTYSKCKDDHLVDTHLQRMSLLRYFPYLRIQDELVWVGFVQLYLEYYQRWLPEMRAAAEIDETMKLDMDVYEDGDEPDDVENKTPN